MTPRELQTGQPYYRITFADPDLTIPGVEPLIYIGVDILEGDGSRSQAEYTFQDTVSFRRFGSAASYRGSIDLADEGATVHTFRENELQDLADLAGVIRALNEAHARAVSLSK